MVQWCSVQAWAGWQGGAAASQWARCDFTRGRGSFWPTRRRGPCRVRRRTEAEHQRIRDKLHIVCDGQNIPPPVPTFAAMRLPGATTRALAADGIAAPTPIQAQALPLLLAGRDCVGISSTGSGKTLAFVLPMLMHALQVGGRRQRLPGGPAVLPACLRGGLGF